MPKGAIRCHVRNRIALVREARGLTQRELAALLGIAHTTLGRWESDQHFPPDAMVGKLAQVLRCRPCDLFPHDFV
ncbi:MAG: Helix-turn-helix domain [Symbiobacteriaceae bacterium]|jgi:transcriptional regulator with XRE-family HTH domain|nr:Helix-turn-helix domain [Symbiobacteriaceae bacterium]